VTGQGAPESAGSTSRNTLPRPVAVSGPRTGSGDTGHGLAGMRQRAAMYGGSVTIGPRDTGHGWIVDIVLDVPPAPVPEVSVPFEQGSSHPSASGEQLP
jgi:hypothetical protein